jgi:hypothetical protein
MTTTRPRFVRNPDTLHITCYGRNHQAEDVHDLGRCYACGREVARYNRKNQLLDVTYRAASGARRTACWHVHECDPDAVVEYQDKIRHELASGQIVVDQHVTVTKGRKVKIGTSGIVMWVGDSHWGPRVGIRVEGVDKPIYLAQGNVTATNQLTEADNSTAEIVADAPNNVAPVVVPAKRSGSSHATCGHDATPAARRRCRSSRSFA